MSRRRPGQLSRAEKRVLDDLRHRVNRGCCRPRQLGPECWEGKIPRIQERECSLIVAESLRLNPDGTLPTMDEVRARVEAMPARRRVQLAVWA